MDDPFHDFESELRKLHPRKPSVGLLVRLERELTGPDTAAGPARPPRRWQFPPTGAPRWLVWPAVAALLTFGGIVIVHREPVGASRLTPPVSEVSAPMELSMAVFKPVGATKFLYASLDEGPALLSDGLPARRVCNRYVDKYTWRNPRTRASVQWIVPREEVRLVPVEAF
jgi:hypothetical protein